MRFYLTVSAVIGCFLSCSGRSSGQSFPSKDALMQSAWASAYSTPNGGQVEANIKFNGRSGTYDTAAGRGKLTNIVYGVDTTSNPGKPFFQITGNWFLGGTSGKFLFASDGPNKFKGSWTSNAGNGAWSGQLAQAGGGGAGGGGAGVGGGGGAGGGQVTYEKDWSFNDDKGYYYKKCMFPAGGYQYLVYYKTKPNWVYWYNPTAQVFWCACPTVNNLKWGNDIKNGKDLFLIANKKARNLEDCEFPPAGDDGANFTKGTTKDKDGSPVSLGCPPTDVP